jgi:hypothetical protein
VVTTRNIGISIFTGMEFTVEENISYIEKAAKIGYKRIFTSMQRPGSDPERVKVEMPIISKRVHELGMEIVTDISPFALRIFKATIEDLTPFKEAGVASLRLDDGFSNKEVADFTMNKAGLKVELNGCHYFYRDLEEIISAGADRKQMQASFNYYPKFETGISLDFVKQQAEAYSHFGVPLFAFVHSSGLHTRTTVESLRYMTPGRAAEELFSIDGIDTVLIGDPLASEEDLDAIAEISSRDYIKIRAKSRKGLTDKEKTLIYDKEMIAKPGTELSLRHTFRFPRGEEHNLVEPRNCVERPIGSVTIDNIGYKDGNNQLTNASEVNVWLRKRPADERINVVADVVEEDLPLARAVKPFRKFMIKESDDHDLLN